MTKEGRCAAMLTGPELVQCPNIGTHSEHVSGCGCEIPDFEICEEGFDIWVCDEHAGFWS